MTSTTIKVINWLDNWRGFIGPLSDKEAENWRSVIVENCRPTTAEVDRAVASLCADDADGKKTKPNAKSIIQRIREHRQQGDMSMMASCPPIANICDSNGGDIQYYRKSMADLKRELGECNDPEAAWDIICEPMNVEQCKALRQFADSHGIAYTRFIPQNTGRFADLVGKMKVRCV
jgi:hypothetical protein